MGFAVIIPTKDRPQLLKAAIGSVLSQSRQADEIIVVDDGSTTEALALTRELVASAGPRARLVELAGIAGGHGPAFSRNAGVAASRSSHICFLDDDDTWIDDRYLAMLAGSLALEPDPFDLHFCDQRAFDGDTEIMRPIWIDELKDVVRGRTVGAAGTYAVSIQDLLGCTGFCHLNTTCVRAAFFNAIGGFNADIRYESDRDFFFRAIDQAACIKFTPRPVARHNIPNRKAAANVSTSFSQIGKWRIQLRIVEALALTARHPEIRAYGRAHRAYTLKKLAKGLFDDGQYRLAYLHARLGLFAGFTLRWAMFTMVALASTVRRDASRTGGR